MTSLFLDLRDQLSQLSPLELTAVLSAIAYLLLAIRQNIWCWACAAISTTIYVFLFFGAKLYMESLLNIFYLAMAVYGWRVWMNAPGAHEELPVSVWPVNLHILALATVAVLSLVTGYLLDTNTDAAYPYIDSVTTYAAVWATFLVARKILENWWYWLAIDLASIFIYWSRDLQLTAVLFAIYVLLIPIGLAAWTRSFHDRQPVGAVA